MKRSNFAVLLCGPFLWSCTQAPPPTSSPPIATTPQSQPTGASTASVAQLTSRVTALENQQTLRAWQAAAEKKASFDPSNSEGFQKLETNLGTFLIVLEGVEPYLDGQRVTLRIGNPYAADVSGLTLDLEWGPRLPVFTSSTSESFDKVLTHYNEATHTKQVQPVEQLRAGAWTKYVFVVAPAKSEDFGRLEVQMNAKSVSLAAPR